MATKLKANGHPIGFALGNATGDANSWCHWLMWTFGGSLTDENDQVTINSKETIEALKYGKELAATFIPGAASWLDPSNNKAFLAGEVSATGNGISVYYAAKNSQDAAIKAMAEDIYHARMPIGPVGRPTERALIVNPMIFTHTKYPNAAKEYLRFMMEEEQYLPWLTASIGYWNHPLKAYDKAPIWTDDPKHTPYQHVLSDAIWDGYKGSVGEASAAVHGGLRRRPDGGLGRDGPGDARGGRRGSRAPREALLQVLRLGRGRRRAAGGPAPTRIGGRRAWR